MPLSVVRKNVYVAVFHNQVRFKYALRVYTENNISHLLAPTNHTVCILRPLRVTLFSISAHLFDDASLCDYGLRFYADLIK